MLGEDKRMKATYSLRLSAAALATLLLALVFAAPVGADQQNRIVDAQGRIVDAIVLLDHTPNASDEALVAGLGGQVGKRLENINVLTVSLPEPALAALSNRPGQWGVNRVDAEIAHVVGTTLTGATWNGEKGSDVVVAVVDTGIDLDHPEFTGRIDDRRMSFAGRKPSSDVSDKNGHGTHTAGIVGARDDGTGVVGVAPAATILPIQVSKGSRITDEAILAAFDYLLGLEEDVDGSVDVVSMSFGSSQSSTAERSALLLLEEAGMTLVASAGNDSGGPVGYPAAYPHVIAVSSTTVDDTLSSFSSVGLTASDLAAPGSSIYSTSKDGGYVHMSGTSMSAPHVAGAAALVIGALPLANARAVLTGSAEHDIGLTDLQMGAGLLDVAAAFGLASGNNLGNVPPVVDAGTDQTVVLPIPVNLSGTATDANGDLLDFSWTVQNAPVGSVATPVASNEKDTTFTPDTAGTYTLQLTVTERDTTDQYSASDTIVITALAEGAEFVTYGVTSITVNRTSQGPWENVVFTVTIKTSTGAPVEGASVTASISRPGRVFADLTDTTDASGQTSFTIRRAVNETYSIVIKNVTDSDPLLVWDGIEASTSEGAG
jgi:subtilisin